MENAFEINYKLSLKSVSQPRLAKKLDRKVPGLSMDVTGKKSFLKIDSCCLGGLCWGILIFKHNERSHLYTSAPTHAP